MVQEKRNIHHQVTQMMENHANYFLQSILQKALPAFVPVLVLHMGRLEALHQLMTTQIRHGVP